MHYSSATPPRYGLHKAQIHQQRLHAVHVQTGGVVRVVIFGLRDFLLTLLDELAVVQITQIWWHTVIVTQILGFGLWGFVGPTSVGLAD